LPYGEEYNPQITTNNYKFTGKERDAETGLDYFGARYYGNALGRFLTPDWAAKATGVPYADFGDPQSLNLYSYVRNNPLARIDPDGHCPAPGDKTQCSDVQVTANPPEQKAKVDVYTRIDENGVAHTGVGPHGDITFTVTVKDKPVDGVKVTEHNDKKEIIGGKDITKPPVEGKGVTKNGGKITDTVGEQVPAGSDKQNALRVQQWSTTSVDVTDKQTLTLKFPDGATCSCTSTRTLTNIDPNGRPTDFTLKTTQPVVTDPQ
jgi:RHS repeat-associated protein